MTVAATPEDVLARMPDWERSGAAISVLVGGLANRSYVARAGDERCVIKILTEQMDSFGLMIRIPDLVHNTVAASRSGVAAGVLAVFPDMPAVVLEFIDGRTLDPEDLAAPGLIPRLGRAVRHLHDGSDKFANHISIFDFLDRYLDLVERHG
ncbi:MAG: protein kinase family protein, partial [Acidimicrobiales bacterium]